jgi:hypothetical protein
VTKISLAGSLTVVIMFHSIENCSEAAGGVRKSEQIRRRSRSKTKAEPELQKSQS